jgi:hypothetical protein
MRAIFGNPGIAQKPVRNAAAELLIYVYISNPLD